MEVDGADEAHDTSSSRGRTSTGGKDPKSSKQMCEDMGIVDVECEFTAEDYTTLLTYKLFQQHVRPFLLEKNPKLVMYKMVSVIGAKWREFLDQKEKWSKEQKETAVAEDANEDGANEEQTIKSLLDENKKELGVADEPVVTGKPKRGAAGRGKAATTKQQQEDEAAATAAAIAAAAAADEADNRRTSSRTKRGAAAAASANIAAAVASESAPLPVSGTTPKAAGRNSRASAAAAQAAAAAASAVSANEEEASNEKPGKDSDNVDHDEDKASTAAAAAAADKAKRTSSGRVVKKRKKRDVSFFVIFL
jgi:hypothetical protein